MTLPVRDRARLQAELRKLHSRIGRQRRRIDGRWKRLGENALLVCFPQRYVQRYPGRTLLAAVGFGMALSGIFGGSRTAGDQASASATAGESRDD